jgi:hypothetical protein
MPTDFDEVSDIVAQLFNRQDLLRGTGISLLALDRFVDAWGKGVEAVGHDKYRPRGAIFLLVSGQTGPGGIAAGDIRNCVKAVRSAQEKYCVLTIDVDGETQKEDTIRAEVRGALSDGAWTPEQASKFSYELPTAITVLVNGYSFLAFSAGATIFEYVDVSRKLGQDASELSRRKGLGPELFLDFGEKVLAGRSRLGIWRLPNERVLRNRPEQVIEELLIHYLQAYLAGYRAVKRQAHAAPNGRIDISVVLSNDRTEIVELKWLGRALKKSSEGWEDDAIRARIKNKWSAGCVTIFEDDSVGAGVIQLGVYLKDPANRHGWLVVVDCRQTGAPVAAARKDVDAAGLEAWQFDLIDIKVNPTVPSQLGSS